MKQQDLRWFWVAGLALAVIMLVGAVAASIYAVWLPEHTLVQETLVYGQTELYPGSQAALRVVVRDVHNTQPIPDAEVQVSLKSQAEGKAVPLFQGNTDAMGSADVKFTVPDEAGTKRYLVIESHSAQGRDKVEREITIARDYKVLLSTDKPIYQPGQVIHIRVLALGSFDLAPASERPLELVITDAKGNKVFRRELLTSVHGVASADFQLADEVNTGNYKIEAILGNTTSESTVVVKHYVLPKFKVTATPDRAFYLPGERVSGAVEAHYFFGKPVEHGEVVMTGYTFDVQLQEVFRIEGETNADGRYDFEFDLPDYLVAGGLEAQVATFIVEVAIIDEAQHTERINLRLPIAQDRIIIEAVPESGSLVEDVENIVYFITAAPDGSPVPTTLTIEAEGQIYTVESGEYGLAEWYFTPSSPWQEIEVTARDARGSEVYRIIVFEGQERSSVLLRPERAVYRMGETMHLDIFSTVGTGALYLDIIREGQTVSTRALEPQYGYAQADIDLTPDLYGTLELHAYALTQGGEIQRDTRVVIVDAPRDLKIAITQDKETYLPGTSAALDFAVTGLGGEGVPAVLGLAAVDESVFALQEQDPGFLKLYFLLEKELMEPKYDIHGLQLSEMLLYPEAQQIARTAQDQAAQANLAGTTTGGGHSLAMNTRTKALSRLEAKQASVADVAIYLVSPIVFLLPLVILALLIIALVKEKVLGPSLLLGAGILFALSLLLSLLPVPDWAGDSLMDRLGYWLGEIGFFLLPAGALVFLSAGVVAWVALVIRAWRGKEPLRGAALGLLVLYALALVMMFLNASLGSVEPGEVSIIVGLLAFALLPLSFLVWSMGEAVQRRTWGALGSFSLVGLVVMIPLGFAFFTMPLGRVQSMMFDEVADGLAPDSGDWEMPAGRAEEESEGLGVSSPPTPAQGEPPRLRQLFGETMAWLPELVTDEVGELHLDLPLYDNITTWRLTTLAHAQDGRLGATTVGLRVFQDFFVDFDLPYAMTQHDEVALPVAVYNYLEQAQEVRLVLEPEPWFELLDASEKVLTVGPNDVEVVRFRIKVVATQGRYRPTVWAYGEHMSDATTATHDVMIRPDGKPFDVTWSDRLEEGTTLYTVQIPDTIITGTARIEAKIYPGVMSQVVEGMDALLRMPYGCFEQTSSTTYPNVLVLDYMETTGQTTPEIQMKAEQYINLGYQRLTAFEVQGGGFSLFGDAPPDRMLTAYGLMEFVDMARVFPVDQAFVDRAARWLLMQQDSDGSWANDRGLVHESSWAGLEDERVPVTAYMVWALTHAGYGDDPGVQQGLSYVREYAYQARDAYVLALVANALVTADPGGGVTRQVLDRLAEVAVVEDDRVYWESGIATMMGAQGKTGSLETTALAAYAFLTAGVESDLANKALLYLVQQKDPSGTWHTTQATILALKALLKSVEMGSESVDAAVTLTLDGGRPRIVEISPENYDVVHAFTFDDINPGAHEVQFAVEGQGSLMVQVTARYYRPWREVPAVEGMEEELLDIAVDYDRTSLAVDDTVRVQVTVQLEREGVVDWALVDLGVPPGFTVMPELLTARVQRDLDLPMDYPGGRLKKFELTGRQILVYLQNLQGGEPMTFTYHLRVRFPVKAQAPASQAYDYYNPGLRAEARPLILTVEGE